MFVRVTSVRKGSQVYRYAQIVKSVRRDSDGMPSHEVVANLGRVDELLVENLRTAFRATAAGTPIVLPSAPIAPVGVRALAYLDVALCLEIWGQLRFGDLLTSVLPPRARDVSIASVVAALVVHRCTAPGSKLSAQAWFPRTGLPELLGVSPAQFNNARVHRALAALEHAGVALQVENARRLSGRPGGFKALYLDVTDTWFVGLGPKGALKRKTKEGLWRRRIGIVLLCDQDGAPVRWQVVDGRKADCRSMVDLVRSLGNVDWLTGIPVACDRAMGQPRTLARLEAAGVHYVTMLPISRFPTFTMDKVPTALTSGINTDADDAVEQAHAAAKRAGLTRVRERMWALDLGVREAVVARPEPRSHRSPPPHAEHLAHARTVQAAREAGEKRVTVIRRLGVSAGTYGRIKDLLRLTQEIQDAIERGDADAFTLEDLRRISRLPGPEQRALFDAGRSTRHVDPGREEDDDGDDDEDDPTGPPVRARVVVTFNPGAFVRSRTGAAAMRERLDEAIKAHNQKLASPRCRRNAQRALLEGTGIVRRFEAEDVFSVEVYETPGTLGPRPQIRLILNMDAWDRRRALDGFGVLVAHPALTATTEELVQTYSDKNRIEEDFHVIKSVVDVRPVFHRTDAKVDAHVTICMLALAVTRGIERAAAGKRTASAVLEELEPVKLLRLLSEPAVHAISEPTADQRALLATMQLGSLLDLTTLPQRLRIVQR